MKGAGLHGDRDLLVPPYSVKAALHCKGMETVSIAISLPVCLLLVH